MMDLVVHWTVVACEGAFALATVLGVIACLIGLFSPKFSTAEVGRGVIKTLVLLGVLIAIHLVARAAGL